MGLLSLCHFSIPLNLLFECASSTQKSLFCSFLASLFSLHDLYCFAMHAQAPHTLKRMKAPIMHATTISPIFRTSPAISMTLSKNVLTVSTAFLTPSNIFSKNSPAASIGFGTSTPLLASTISKRAKPAIRRSPIRNGNNPMAPAHNATTRATRARAKRAKRIHFQVSFDFLSDSSDFSSESSPIRTRSISCCCFSESWTP